MPFVNPAPFALGMAAAGATADEIRQIVNFPHLPEAVVDLVNDRVPSFATHEDMQRWFYFAAEANQIAVEIEWPIADERSPRRHLLDYVELDGSGRPTLVVEFKKAVPTPRMAQEARDQARRYQRACDGEPKTLVVAETIGPKVIRSGAIRIVDTQTFGKRFLTGRFYSAAGRRFNRSAA